jgi:stage II sporulation protein D
MWQRGTVTVRETGTASAGVLAWPADGRVLSLDGQPFRGYVDVRAVNGGLVAVNVVDLQDYLQGVLKDEIPPGWPTEASKAMAVAARTYAVYRRFQDPDALFHLRATTASQVYGGVRGEDPRTNFAVEVTRGQVLTFGGQPFPAFYHSCSGGATEDATDVFGVEYDIVPGVADNFSLGCPHALWIAQLAPRQIEVSLGRAGYAVGHIVSIQDLIRSRTGRILHIEIRHGRGTLVLEGKRFREALGYDVIRSTDFQVRVDHSVFTFIGRGSGHGVGMSQWGAKEMADMAYRYHEILRFYYPLATLAVWPK